jgi:hypothetical protein
MRERKRIVDADQRGLGQPVSDGSTNRIRMRVERVPRKMMSIEIAKDDGIVIRWKKIWVEGARTSLTG